MNTGRPLTPATATKVVVASTVMLSFVNFWRASAIVLSDLASSAYYAGGIAEQALGRSAPWYILCVMLFSYAVRSVYLESCSMFVRGGVYVVVRDAMGPFLARISVSALIFDYILTGPISSVTAGIYLASLLNDISAATHSSWHIPRNAFAAAFGIAVTGYFWRANIRGIHESSGKALRIMQVTTVMLVIMLLWSGFTLLVRGPSQIPPAPSAANLHFSEDGLGWFQGTFWLTIPFVAIIIAFGHSLLSMSGFETLAQVYREIAYPKLRNLQIAGTLVCTYAVICTGLTTLLAGMLIPLDVRDRYLDNLLGGLAMNQAGPMILRLGFNAIVTVVGVLLLSGAVNTSLIGSNGVLNRLAEDGVLVDWFRRPHRRFGTTYRLIHCIAGLQVLTIAASRGDMYLLGEAYAFGVVWSFFMKSLGVLVIRFRRGDQEYKHPGNFVIAGREIPIGLISTTSVLFMVAIANLFSKKIATIYGILFTVLLFAVFTISQRLNAKKRAETRSDLEKFNIDIRPDILAEDLGARPGCVLIAVRDHTRFHHLQTVLQKTNLRRHDIVVMTVRPVTAGAAEYQLGENQLFSDYEQELFSKVVTLAEKEGKHVDLVVVPGVDPFDAMVQTAARLQASKLVTGLSERMDQAELAQRIGLAWEKLPEPRHAFSLEVASPGRASTFVNLGPHPPRLWPEDLVRLHDLWLDLSERIGHKLHHRDVVSLALRRMERDLKSIDRNTLITELEREIRADAEERTGKAPATNNSQPAPSEPRT